VDMGGGNLEEIVVVDSSWDIGVRGNDAVD
jgi:hypothetical protein